MMRKMFLMGALCMGLANAGAVGAWAAPSDPKLAAFFAAMPSNEGCPPTGTAVDDTTELQPRLPDPPPPPTPCERATKALEDADRDIQTAKERKQSALDNLVLAKERSNNPNLTEQQRFDAQRSVGPYEREYNYRTGALSNAENARPDVQRAKDIECDKPVEEDLGPAPAPEPAFSESASFFLPDGDEGGS